MVPHNILTVCLANERHVRRTRPKVYNGQGWALSRGALQRSGRATILRGLIAWSDKTYSDVYRPVRWTLVLRALWSPIITAPSSCYRTPLLVKRDVASTPGRYKTFSRVLRISKCREHQKHGLNTPNSGTSSITANKSDILIHFDYIYLIWLTS